MLPKRLRECLDIVRWPPSTLAAALNVEAGVAEGWLNGTRDIPSHVASWLEALCFTHEAAELMRPFLSAGEQAHGFKRQHAPEHVPVYSYNLLRSLGQGPVQLRSLFGTDDEGAVFFLVSRGLAERVDESLVITDTGRRIGQVGHPSP